MENQESLTRALSDRYQIEREIGSGGMATVYLAQDLKHDRRVAVKVLKPELAAVVGTERFLAEIRTTANLAHPHILPLFDSGEADGFLFYVMPFVEDESLRQRLDRDGQLPVEEAVRIAGHVADALDYAHLQGVIHRDIKPGNILFQAGDPVVTDFGIALAISAAGEGRLTETGLSLGTPFYMSPEQAAGDQTPTAASDVYSLGCVLYEMLTGEPPHTGASAQAILGKILLADVTRPTKLRRTIPANVEAVVLKALERLPADRFESGAELSAALKDKSFRHGGERATVADRRLWNPLSLGLAAVIVLFVGLALWMWPRQPPPRVTRSNVVLPPDSGIVWDFGPSVALSPDGSRLVYVGPGVEGGQALWLKERDELKPRRLPGTEDAHQPFFSPDGDEIGFIGQNESADRVLKAIPVSGGPPRELADSGFVRGGPAWGADGYIYVGGANGGLVKVPEVGGKVIPVTTLAEGEIRHRWPQVLPNGRAVLFTVMRAGVYDNTGASIAVVDLSSGEHRDLLPGVLARYVPSDHLVVVDENGQLLAARFDPEEMVVEPPVPILEGVLVGGDGTFGGADLALSADGTLLYVAGDLGPGEREVVWVDRDGTERPVDPAWDADVFGTVALSPDDRRLAVSITADVAQQIWVKELLPGGPLTRLTVDDGRSRRPVWSANGRTIAYVYDEGYVGSARRVRSDGSDLDTFEVILNSERGVLEVAYTPDERGLIFRTGDQNIGMADLGYVDLDADTVNERLLASGFNERAVDISPDGRWIAYVSDVTGRDEVFVRPFPATGTSQTQVSTNGGLEPMWAHDGIEIFYRDLDDGWLVSALYEADTSFRVAGWERLFDASDYLPGLGWHNYDVTLDDQRFVFIRVLSQRVENASLVLVQNFFTELEEGVGGRR